MGDDERALIRAIAAAPADDLPRLVYADWLEEHGRGERAALIRTEVDLANVRLADPGGREEYDRLTKLRSEAVRRLGRDWEREAFTGLPVNPKTRLVYDRGMATRLTCTAKYFLENGDELLERFPLTSVELVAVGKGNIPKLARCPAFARLPGLSLDARATPVETILAVLSVVPVGGLRSLSVSGSYLVSGDRETTADPVAVAISKSQRLGGLLSLRLWAARIGDAGGTALAESTTLTGLRRLDLQDNPLSESVREVLRKRYGDVVILDDPDGKRLWLGAL